MAFIDFMPFIIFMPFILFMDFIDFISFRDFTGLYQMPADLTLIRNPGICIRSEKTEKTKKQNPSIYSGFWTPIDWESLLFLLFFCFFCVFCLFCFFWCLPIFCEIVLWFFFGACQCFSSIITKQDAKNCVSPRFQSHQMQKTSVFTVFSAHVHSKITSAWSPALKKNYIIWRFPKMVVPLHHP